MTVRRRAESEYVCGIGRREMGAVKGYEVLEMDSDKEHSVASAIF